MYVLMLRHCFILVKPFLYIFFLRIYCITLFRYRQYFLGNFNNFAFYTVNILTKSHINKAIADMGNGKELLKLYVEENDVVDDGIVNCKI